MTTSFSLPSDSKLLAELRAKARAIFDHALAECNVARAFAREVQFDIGVLHLAGEDYELARFSRLAVVSIGKAGHSMAEAPPLMKKSTSASMGIARSKSRIALPARSESSFGMGCPPTK